VKPFLRKNLDKYPGAVHNQAISTMRIAEIKPNQNYTLQIVFEDGNTGIFDVSPYLELEAFTDLKNQDAFQRVINGGYFVEWDCGADLSADTIEAHLKTT
jgi:hypothetical protein